MRSPLWWTMLTITALLSLNALTALAVRSYEPPWRNWQWDVDQDELHDEVNRLVRGHSQSNVSVAVFFESAPSEAEIEQLESITGAEISYPLSSIPAVILTVEPERLTQVPDLPRVTAVDFLPDLDQNLDVSARAVKVRSSTTYSPDTIEDAFGLSGSGILIGVIDSGVDDQHQSLEGMYHVGGNFGDAVDLTCINPADGSSEDVRHGTHVAGIALGTGGPSGTFRGMTTHSSLVDLRTISSFGTTSSGSVIRAFDWAIRWNRQQTSCFHVPFVPIHVINLSLGGDDDCGQGAMSSIVREAFSAGIVVVHSIGNNGVIGSPTPDGGTIFVANINDQDTVTRADDQLRQTSSRGPRCSDGDEDTLDEKIPTIGAPGTLIKSPHTRVLEDGSLCLTCYSEFSGTSEASPHVAGIVAMMIERRPCLAPASGDDARVRNLLINSTEYRTEAEGTPVSESTGLFGKTWNNGWGYGYVNAVEAIRHVDASSC